MLPKIGLKEIILSRAYSITVLRQLIEETAIEETPLALMTAHKNALEWGAFAALTLTCIILLTWTTPHEEKYRRLSPIHIDYEKIMHDTKIFAIVIFVIFGKNIEPAL